MATSAWGSQSKQPRDRFPSHPPDSSLQATDTKKCSVSKLGWDSVFVFFS